ncbi:serine/threonine protein kinase, partial [Suhomyces tanzawaensis NRRL Y-17324]
EYAAYESHLLLLNGRYRFVRNIQNGAFGKVSLAVDTVSNTHVSIKAISKVLPAKRLPGEKTLLEIAHLEIAILRTLNLQLAGSKYDNANICKLLSSFETEDFIVLVLEYCSNGDLYDLIHERSLSISEILKLANQMNNAIQFAHDNSVYHRDLKPENILIDDQFNFKLCDWGLATTSRYCDEFHVGTEKYMAPECLLKDKSADGKYDCTFADYWSYGITMLTAVFGTSPFKEPSNTKPVLSDYNFKNFVLFNNPYILYDIYPSMNSNCFDIFMNILKVGSDEDDANNFSAKAHSRDIAQFLLELNTKWVHGLTVDDDFDEENVQLQIDSGVLIPHNHDVFDMDHDDLKFFSIDTKPSSVEDEDEFDDEEYELVEYNNASSNIPIASPKKQEVSSQSTQPSMKLPSLVESSIKSSVSWCDLDDED